MRITIPAVVALLLLAGCSAPSSSECSSNGPRQIVLRPPAEVRVNETPDVQASLTNGSACAAKLPIPFELKVQLFDETGREAPVETRPHFDKMSVAEVAPGGSLALGSFPSPAPWHAGTFRLVAATSDGSWNGSATYVVGASA